MSEEREEGTVRIYFQNLNGLKLDKDGGRWPMICQAMTAIGADIMGFAEINHDTSQFQVKRQIEQIAQKYFEHQRIISGTSNRMVRKTYKPGGTMMMTVHNMVTLVRETNRDRMGRWVSTRYQGNNPQSLTVIMAYQVCQTSRSGRNTAATQQMKMILQESIATGSQARPSPREAFIHDLKQFITHRQAEGDLIALFGDFNETITDPNAGIARLASDCGLADACAYKLGNPDIPNTYKRSQRRIDFILVSPEVLPAIRRLGYDPFDYRGIMSDHRGLMIDVDVTQLLGNQPLVLAPLQRRDFTADRPDRVKKYVETKYSELLHHNIQQRLNQLENLAEPDHDLAERIDRDITRASLLAAKAARERHKAPWSPELAKAWATIHLYEAIRSQLRNPHINNWAAIRKWQERHTNMPQQLPTTLNEVEQCLKEARSTLKNIRKRADEHRQTYLEEKAQLYAALAQSGKERIIRQLQRAEDLSRCYRKLKYIRNEATNQGLTEVQVPRDPNIDPKQCPQDPAHWRTVRVPQEVTEILIERNRNHFGQAHGTPLTQEGFLAQVKYDGTGITSELILQGEYQNEDMDRASQLFMRHMTRKTLTELSSHITKEEFIGKVKKWPESTTTSPSGLHLGHYHALWKKHNINPNVQPAEAQQFEKKRDFLIRAHVAILNYALKFGYSFQRWHKVVNIMLRKDANNAHIHRLRVIHLYEADYNLLLATKWRETLHHAEDQGLLNEGLYGSRPGRSAHDPVFIEVMQNEIYRASMKSGLNKDLDATSCYDRILAWIANICSRRMGTHKMVAAVNSRTLEQAKFHLKTDIGVSSDFYQHCDAYPIYGTGQGSGNSPHLWCFVASALFDAFEQKAHGASFFSYDGTKSVRLYMIGFVDDCSQRVNEFQAHPQPTAAQLVQIMEKDAQLWNDLLWASGGALEIPKCSFQLIETEWSPRGRPFLKGFCDAPPLRITNARGQIQVKQLSNYQARRSLGVHLSPSGMMNTQYETLLAKSKNYARMLLTNALSRREARMLFLGIYIPSITYPLAITCLTEGQCQAIETPVLKSVLPRCGYNRSMSRSIRYAPIGYGGAGFLSLYAEQMVYTILTAIKHLRCQEMQPGKMELIALTWAQAHVGVSWSIWENPDRLIPKLPTPWIDGIRRSLVRLDAKLIIADETIPPKLRLRDWYLMDAALSSQQFNAAEIEDINAVRRFHQAITVADIADDRGVKIREEIWNGTESPDPSSYNCELLNQRRPVARAQRTWKKFLRLFTTQDKFLQESLGGWIVNHSKCRRRPKWVYDDRTQQLYMHMANTRYALCNPRGRRYEKPENDENALDLPPPHAYPVHVYDLGHCVEVQHNYIRIPSPTGASATFQAFVEELDEWESQLLRHTELLEAPHRIMELLNDGAVTFVASDGSVREATRGSFGFVVTHVPSRRRLVKGCGIVPGSRISSFRAEAYGVLAVGRLLLRLSEFTGGMLPRRICHWVDNQGVASRIESLLTRKQINPNSTLQPDWDVVQEAVCTIQQMDGVHYSIKWIKGHQDVDQAYEHLTLAAQLNCDSDALATRFQENNQQNAQNVQKVPMMPHTKVQLEIKGRTITSSYKTAIRQSAVLPDYFKYLQQRFKWKGGTHGTVDWDIMSNLAASQDDRRATFVKHIHGFAPTGKYAHRNAEHEPASCPACGVEVETNEHLWVCPADSRAQWRARTIQKVLQGRYDLSENEVLWAILEDGVEKVLTGATALVAPNNYPREYRQLIQDQNDIGWEQLFRCRWAQAWRSTHARTAQRNATLTPEAAAQAWVLKRGRTLINQWWELWKIRTEERHGRNQEATRLHNQEVAESYLQELYQYKRKVMPVDKDLFPYHSAQEHLANGGTPEQILEWCMDSKSCIVASYKQAQALGIEGTQDIRRYTITTGGGMALHRPNHDSVQPPGAPEP